MNPVDGLRAEPSPHENYWNTLEFALGMLFRGNETELLKQDPAGSLGLRDAELEATLMELRAELDATRDALNAATNEKANLEARLVESETVFRSHTVELARYQAELESANDRLRNLAVTDDLTGLRNRRAFEERLTFEFSMARRKRRELSVVILDADDFKQVNDSLGHQVGDSVLQQLAKVLRNTVRVTDLAVRFGGEEFAVILTETDERSALMWCRRMRNALQSAEWESRAVTVSMGVARMTAACVDGNHLVAMADEALYRAKALGKDCYVGSGEVQIDLV